MELTNEQRKRLTETNYVKLEVGETVNFVLANWRYNEKMINGQNVPMLVFDVLKINGINQNPVREWSTTGKIVNALLLKYIDSANLAMLPTLELQVTKTSAKTYQVVDLRLVRQLASGEVTK